MIVTINDSIDCHELHWGLAGTWCAKEKKRHFFLQSVFRLDGDSWFETDGDDHGSGWCWYSCYSVEYDIHATDVDIHVDNICFQTPTWTGYIDLTFKQVLQKGKSILGGKGMSGLDVVAYSIVLHA